ncbi:thiol peroxidase [Nocardioides lentus]|uniref:Thiol peroxidase n=1 Tax=Nocardioides lentus TaxID=338077 RepID=A0ABP5AMB3_9ACTN
MATTALGGTPCETCGPLPEVGSAAPSYELLTSDMTDVGPQPGTATVLNVFPSVDTSVCAASVRRFNELAAGLDGARVVCVSHDLPFALRRFCGAEGVDDVVVATAFRSSFGEDYGLRLVDGAFAQLLARAVVVVDGEGVVRHVQLVDDISSEPDYDAALAALAAAG